MRAGSPQPIPHHFTQSAAAGADQLARVALLQLRECGLRAPGRRRQRCCGLSFEPLTLLSSCGRRLDQRILKLPPLAPGRRQRRSMRAAQRVALSRPCVRRGRVLLQQG